jgi:broad specificity phosphatase PhoE
MKMSSDGNLLIKGVVSVDMSIILLVRHGESKSNAGLPTSCPKLVELTGKGLKQAEDIAYILKSQPAPELIVTSSYLRTQQTAKPTRLAFPFVPEEEWPVHEFTYLSPSYWNEDTTSKDREPLVKAYWETCDPAYVDGPGSESFVLFIKRIKQFLFRLRETSHDTIAVFSHEQFICAFLWCLQLGWLNLTQDDMKDYREFLDANPIPNGGIVRVQFDDDYASWNYAMIAPYYKTPIPIRA